MQDKKEKEKTMYVNPIAGYAANFIFGAAAILFALMTLTNALKHKVWPLLSGLLFMVLCLFLAISFDPAVSNPHLSDIVRGQKFRSELLHQCLLCTVAAIVYYAVRLNPELAKRHQQNGKAV